MPSLNTGNAILSNPIKVDSSYNVGIGGAASGSFKLQVTGTTNLTGALSGTTSAFTTRVDIGTRSSGNIRNLNIYGATNGNAIIKLDGADGNGYGAQIDFISKTSGGTSNNWTLGTGITGGTNAFELFNGTSTVFNLTTTGAATFSSSVTAESLNISSASTSPVGLTITGGDEAFVKFMQSGGVLKNWGFISSNLAVSDFGIYQSTSNGGDPFSAGTPRLYIDGIGNVAIGDTNASANLWVKNSGAANLFGVRNTNASFAATVGFFGADRNTTNNSFYYIDCYNYGSSSYRFRVADSGAVTSDSSVTAKSSITVTNSGAQEAILSAVSSFADGYRATLRLWNQHTGGKAWEVYSTNDADGAYGGGKLAFVNSTNFTTAMVMTSAGRVGIENTAPQGKLEVGRTASNTTAGGHFFSTFVVPVNTWTTIFYAPNNNWNAITEFTWTSSGDYNRSGAAYMRWAYGAGDTLAVVYTLFNNSQNANATFRNSGGEIQIYITGGAVSYNVQVRIQGSQAA